MGNLLILNGSPRAPRSNSRRYAQIFSSCYGENTEYFDITKRNHPELCAKLAVSILINRGFLEPQQNEMAWRLCACSADKITIPLAPF